MSQVLRSHQEEDLIWVTEDAEVQRKYAGQYVVPFQRRVVAHGTNLVTVLREAERVTGKPANELPDCAIPDLLQEVPQ